MYKGIYIYICIYIYKHVIYVYKYIYRFINQLLQTKLRYGITNRIITRFSPHTETAHALRLCGSCSGDPVLSVHVEATAQAQIHHPGWKRLLVKAVGFSTNQLFENSQDELEQRSATRMGGDLAILNGRTISSTNGRANLSCQS